MTCMVIVITDNEMVTIAWPLWFAPAIPITMLIFEDRPLPAPRYGRARKAEGTGACAFFHSLG